MDIVSSNTIENNIDDIKSIISKWDNRLSWDNYFMCIAFLVSARSSCKRLNVGCVIVKDNRIVSVGYNGFLPKAPHISRVVDGHEQSTVHSEQNAVSYAAKKGISIENSTAYITHYPCIHCYKILISAGIKEIKYNDDYKNNELVQILAKENNIEIIKL